MARYGTDQVRYALDEIDTASETNLTVALSQSKLMVKKQK